MKQAHCWTLLLTLAVSACGGGGGGASSSAAATSTHDFAAGGPNVVAVNVGPGPAGVSQTFNIPLTSVTVCVPGTNTCTTINDVLVDTGSSGLRLMASVLSQLTLPPMADPNNAGNHFHECLPFADAYSWGTVATADVSIGAESAKSVAVQIIDDNSTSPAAPTDCTSWGTPLDSVAAFDANGVLGVGLFDQDCGSSCTGCSSASGGCTDGTTGNTIYYSCGSSDGSCHPAALTDQVVNPVAHFPTDNNGVVLQLPSISPTGSPTANGYLVFGIGTESNNALADATVLTTDTQGNITTTYDGQSLHDSFIDSGSNGLYFPNSSNPTIALCGSTGTFADFYCPPSTTTLSATNQGQNGTTSAVSFQVANLINISNADFAINNVGGPATAAIGFSGYFDWGLPFFYGRTVFTAIEGATVGGISGPYYAY